MSINRLVFWRARAVVLACLGLAVLPAAADDSPLELRGFGTLGLARSSSNQADYLRDLSQPDGSRGQWSSNLDSLLGFQANYRLSRRVETVVQIDSRYRYDGSYRPELSWAYAKFDPTPDLSVRVGRLGTEFYLLADSRLVGYSYLTVRPSVDYFDDLPFYNIDGFDVQATHPLGDGLVKGKLFAGRSHETVPFEAGLDWNLRGSPMSGGYLDYLNGPWQWRLGYAQIRFNQELPLNAAFDTLNYYGFQNVVHSLGVYGKTARYLSVGATYDSGPWQLQLMLSRTRQSDIYENGHAGHFLAGYRTGAFTPYLGYSWWKTTANTVDAALPPPLSQQVAMAMAGTHSDQRTDTLGVRWDFREDMALKAQWDRVRGTPSSIFPVRAEKLDWDGNTNVLSLTLDFVF